MLNFINRSRRGLKSRSAQTTVAIGAEALRKIAATAFFPKFQAEKTELRFKP